MKFLPRSVTAYHSGTAVRAPGLSEVLKSFLFKKYDWSDLKTVLSSEKLSILNMLKLQTTQ